MGVKRVVTVTWEDENGTGISVARGTDVVVLTVMTRYSEETCVTFDNGDFLAFVDEVLTPIAEAVQADVAARRG